jgi:hypothetical protein
MTGASNTLAQQALSWTDEVRQELDRAMIREKEFRAAIRKDRLRQLDDRLTHLDMPGRTRPQNTTI